MLGVIAHHWLPTAWRGPLPLEIGLFFFLTLSGFLITRTLLYDREVGERSGSGWRWRQFIYFEKRRMLRVALPCYVAMLFALAVGAPDIRLHFFSYFSHCANFHMAYLEGWPSATAHYWTLAIQIQFYLLWPIVVFFTPRRWLGPVFLACVAAAPLSRMILKNHFPAIHHSEAMTFTALDYFGCGALLALGLHRGMIAGHLKFNYLAWLAFASYTFLQLGPNYPHSLAGLDYIKQTLLALAFTGLISSTLAGIGGICGSVLDHPIMQHIGKLSFGLYLFHTPAQLLLGNLCPWLWGPWMVGAWQILQLLAFSLTSWGLAYLCWKYLESKPPLHAPHIRELPAALPHSPLT